MYFKGKVFVITGGGNGIGQQMVLNLLARGARVAVVDIDQEGLDKTEKLAGLDSSHLSKHILDITDREAVNTLPEAVVDFHGAIDGLINNAGVIQHSVKINQMDYDIIQRVMTINFYGTLNMTKTFLPFLLERPEAYLVNISSMGGFLPVPGQGIYGASKSAIKLFTEALYAELSETAVQVSVVFPGGVRTGIVDQLGADNLTIKALSGMGAFFNPMSPEKAASEIIRGVEKGCFQIFVGIDSKFMNFLYRLNPKFATNFIKKQMSSLLGD